ncbi:MAG: GAF domain-containing protein, partial [Candidatus Cloacimonetes bacterium]|nr:GAF domain-containing protein [Candidatus Cloacimonadota bacterium]
TVRYKSGEGLTGWVLKHKEKLLIQNLDEQTDESLKKKFGSDINWKSKFVEGETKKAKSFIAVPIMSKNRKFYGVLRSSAVDTNFTYNQLEIFTNIADYIGIAIENSYLYLKEHKKADYFKLLTEFGTKLHSHYRLDDLIKFVAQEVAMTFSAETCEIYLRDEKNPNILILRAGYGIPQELINSATHFIGEGLTGTIVKENRIIRLKNVLNYPKYKGKYRSRMKENLKYGDRLAFLGIPIVVKTDVIGCIKLYNKIPRFSSSETYFTTDDENYLDILVYMLSIAIENLQYLSSMQTSAIQIIKTQRLTALGTMAMRLPNEITNSLTTAHLAVKNLQKKIVKGCANFDSSELSEKLGLIDSSLKEAADGVKTLQEFSTKAGFLKIKKTFQEIIDEALLYLSDEILHKKINIYRDRTKEIEIPEILVEPNEMIEVVINLLIIAISPLKHYKSHLFMDLSIIENCCLYMEIHSVDNLSEVVFENSQKNLGDNEDIVTPQQFMFNVSEEIISNNYKGKIISTALNDGMLITVTIPLN